MIIPVEMCSALELVYFNLVLPHSPHPTLTEEGLPRPRPVDMGRRKDGKLVGWRWAAQGGPGKSGTRLPSSPVWTQSGQWIQLALIQVEARLGYTVRVRPRRAKTVGHVREDTAWTPRDGGRGSRAEI